MINQEEKNKRLEELRKRAEKQLHRLDEGRTQAASENELKRLLHELQVHQVELEMQNEELMRSRQEIEQSNKEYTNLYQYAPVCYFTLDAQGHIINHNLLAAQFLGFERNNLYYKKWIIFVAAEHTHIYYSFFKKIIETQTKQITRLGVWTKNGERKIVQLQGIPAQPKEDTSNELLQILLTATDITDLEKAEQEKHYAEQFRHVIEGIPGLYLFLAPDYVILEASNHYLEVFHIERSQVIGYTITELFSQDTLHNNFSSALLQSLLHVSYNQHPHSTQILRYDIPQPDGHSKERYWRVTHSPVLNGQSGIDYIIHQVIDVTGEYLAQQELKSSRQRFEMLALASNDIVWEWNIITGEWWWNQNLESYFGYKRGLLESGIEAWAKRIHPEDKERAIAQMMETVINGRNEHRQEYRFLRADGTYAYVLDRAYALQDESSKTRLLLGTMVDISDQKEVEIALRQSNIQLKLLLETIPQLAWLSQSDGNTFYYNRKWYAYTGAREQDLKDWGWQQYVHPEDVEEIIQRWKNALQTGETTILQCRWWQASNRQYRWHTGQMIPVHDEHGRIIYWVGSLTDIHDQKLIEEALRDNAELQETQRKLQMERDFSRSLINNTIDGIFTFDQTPCYTSWNPVLENIYGISREQVVGNKIFEVFPEYQQTEEGQAILRVLQGKKITLYKQPYENREGFYELNLIPLQNNTGEIIGGLGIVHDVTEHIKLEEERTKLKLKRQKNLLNAILEAQEGERRRIAEALHNGLAQTLYAAKLQFEQMPVEQANCKQLIEIKENANELLANAIQETRHLSHQLIPTILEDFGLKGAINDFCKKYAHGNLVIKTEIYGLDEQMDKHLEIAIYRIAQELVNNSIKHAQANYLHLHLVKRRIRNYAKGNG
jgi:PAS domain S-box-containing protein